MNAYSNGATGWRYDGTNPACGDGGAIMLAGEQYICPECHKEHGQRESCAPEGLL